MLNKLTNFEKKFISSNVIQGIGMYIYDVIFNFFIWEKTNDINLVITFSLFYFIFTLISFIFSEYLVSKYYAKWIRIIGIALLIPYGLSILFMGDIVVLEIIYLGSLYGLSLGIRAQPFYILDRNYINPNNRGLVTSINSAITNFTRIFLPLILSQIISITDSYTYPFMIAIIMIIACIIPLVFIKNRDENRSPVNFKEGLSIIRSSNDIRMLMLLNFFNGIYGAITTSAMGIIVFYIVGGMGNWGIFNTIVTFIQIIVMIKIGSKIKLQITPLVFAILSVSFGFGAVYFANNFNFVGLVVFTTLSIPFNSLFGTVQSVLRGKVLDFEVREEKLVDEVNVFFEMTLALGRILPLIIMLYIGINFDNEIVLKIFIVILGFSSIAMFSAMSSISFTKSRNDPFLNA